MATYGTYAGRRSQVHCAPGHGREPPAAALDAAEGRGAPALRRDRRARRAASRSSATRRLLDDHSIAVGPFARLDANAVAARDGKTRGAISNLFGSQAAFQAETMALALSAGDWIERIEYPDPRDVPGRRRVARRVPRRASRRAARATAATRPSTTASLWALWLSAVPVRAVERAGQPAEHGGARPGGRGASSGCSAARSTTSGSRCARTPRSTTSRARCASLIEGVWLNQCLTTPAPDRPGRADRDHAAARRPASLARRYPLKLVGGGIQRRRAAAVLRPRHGHWFGSLPFSSTYQFVQPRVPDRAGERARAARGRTRRRPRAGPRSCARRRAPRSRARRSRAPCAASIV